MSTLPRVPAIKERHLQNGKEGSPAIITGQASFLLRHFLALTPQKTSDLSSVKRNKLIKFEKGDAKLSPRDRMWLQAFFEAAGAEFFTGQGKLFVRVKEREIIAHGNIAPELTNLPAGSACREERYKRNWSQNKTARYSGVKQHLISAIENNKFPPAFMRDQFRLKICFERNPVI